MAADKRYKKRKRKGRLIGKIIAGLVSVLVICIAGGVFMKIGLPAILNEKDSGGVPMGDSSIKTSAQPVDSLQEPVVVSNDTDASGDTQIPVSSELGTEKRSPEEIERDCELWVDEQLSRMGMNDKAAQLFFVAVDTLTQVENTTIAGDTYRERFDRFPVGGIVLLDGNIVSPDQLKSLTGTAREISGERVGTDLFVGVEEEGGRVLQIANKPEFGLNDVGSMTDIGAGDDAEAAFKAGDYIGSYLSEYGINVDFAPVADLISDTPNSVVEGRAFGRDSVLVSDMVSKEVEGLKKWNVSAVLKHFPGHGTTEGNPAEGDAVSYGTQTELETFDYLPFRKGIDAGADFVMVGHITMQTMGQELPASLSSYFMTDILKNDWGYDGIIITDDMSMAAISNRLSLADAAVMAINAGADMIFVKSDFEAAIQGVVEAINEGEISTERIDESVRRILRIKYMKYYNR